MTYSVYLLISKHKGRILSYVGYTKDIKKRLKLHNVSRGAKYTKGKKWIVFHKEIYNSKSKAMSREYELKNDKQFRKSLKQKFVSIDNKNSFTKNRLQ